MPIEWWIAMIPGVALFVFFPPWRVGRKELPPPPSGEGEVSDD